MTARRVLLSGVVLAQPMGGVRRHAAELLPRVARRLAERGGGLTVLCGRAPPAVELPPEVERAPSDVPARPIPVRALLESRALASALAAARGAGRPFDLVHTAHLPAPRGLAAPLVLLLHDLKVLDGAHTPFSRRLVGRGVVQRALARAAAVAVVSAALRDELLERFRVPAERVHVVPNGADHLDVLPREPGADAPLACVGHLEPRKNVELLLRALALDPGLPRLVLAGADVGGERARLEGVARELGVAGRVDFAGPLDDAALARLYARAACVVLPSRREGFGIPAAEASRAGAPLAVARTPALVEVAGPDAPSFDVGDARACAAAIRAALAATPVTLARAAERAAALTWDASAERLLACWDAALG